MSTETKFWVPMPQASADELHRRLRELATLLGVSEQAALTSVIGDYWAKKKLKEESN